MNLLFDDIEVIESVGDPSSVEVSGISHDSRRVVPGDLFCCVPGHVSDGHVHAAEAVDRGAIGLLCEHFIPELIDHDVVQTRIAAGTMRPVMARLAAAFYGYPARDLLIPRQRRPQSSKLPCRPLMNSRRKRLRPVNGSQDLRS